MMFAPVYTPASKTLIVGTYPSPKSRVDGFYYGHPQNRFWRILSYLYQEPLPASIEEKINFLQKHQIALWDTVAHCTITGASDSSIRDIVPSDLAGLCRLAPIETILCNGALAYRICTKYHTLRQDIKIVRLPASSPANASFSLAKLCEHWGAYLP